MQIFNPVIEPQKLALVLAGEALFDTAPMLVVIALFSAFDRAGVNPPGIVGITIAITYIVGTLQWFLIGGGIGAILERFFEGLRTPDPEDDQWF